ncbi:MAG: hypothetical protein ABIG66_00290 [Candidatus Kerfeldbacteria bacterium]
MNERRRKAREPKDPKHEQLKKELRDYLNDEERDVLGFGDKVIDSEATQSQYEKLIPELEKECLARIELLETNQVAMRGDYLPPDVIQQRLDRVISTSSIRNRPLDLQKADDRQAALATLLSAVEKCVTIAFNNEARLSEGRHSLFANAIPAIFYTANPFSELEVDAAKKSIGSKRDEFFYGEGDDIGDVFLPERTAVIRFPRSGNIDMRSWRGDTTRRYFPLGSVVATEETPEDTPELRKRLEKFGTALRKGVSISHVTNVVLSHPKTYFNMLLIADAVLANAEKHSGEQA